MINFKNDYCSLGHIEILKKMISIEENKETFVGYGMDEVCDRARKLILKEVANKKSKVHFMMGGTSTNKIFISHVLKPYEAVIAADTGHINVHETGAIENNGHKVITIPNNKGKICVEDIRRVVKEHTDEHMVKPRMVYISNSTEYGTIYVLEELKELYSVCKELGLYLFIDGARLAVALTANNSDFSMEDLGKYCDAFYIGGTKNGALFGEALVINDPELDENFRYTMKQNGGMAAKGFAIGVQFETLFTNDLIYKIGRKENELADILRDGIKVLNLELYNENTTNQVFVLFDKNVASKVEKEIACEVFGEVGDKVCIRFVTHYNLEEDEIHKGLRKIKEIIEGVE